MGLVVSTAPTIYPVSQTEVKKHLEIAVSDTSHDDHIDMLTATATEKAEAYSKQSFINRTYQLKLDKFPRWEIMLPRPPLSSVSSISYVDGDGATQTLSSSLYLVSTSSKPGRVTPAYNEVWPETRNIIDAVTVTYVAGYGATSASVPQRARQAILLMVGTWFENREGVSDGSMSEVPMGARWLLDGLKTGMYAGSFGLT